MSFDILRGERESSQKAYAKEVVDALSGLDSQGVEETQANMSATLSGRRRELRNTSFTCVNPLIRSVSFRFNAVITRIRAPYETFAYFRLVLGDSSKTRCRFSTLQRCCSVKLL